MKKFNISPLALAVLSASTSGLLYAQDQNEQPTANPEVIEEVHVMGIRASLDSALKAKRETANLTEFIQSEDIGKLPDQNLAEVLENITGIQITRSAGVGTGVQIRGTNANRTEINGISTVGSGSGRGGINFEDVSASIISGVEVTKAPDATTIEGSVGGTINLTTIRPLELSEMLGAVSVQGEDSSLSPDGITPRVSGTWGDNWSTDAGDFGFVISGSYAEQDVTAFRPRVDRDNIVRSDSGAASAQAFDFLPIQFLNQDYDNYEYETQNYVTTFEWAPNDNTKFWVDGVFNRQDRKEESSRVQASGVSGLRNISIPSSFEEVNFGTLDGVDLGSIMAAQVGVLPVEADGSDPNLRFSSDTNSRITDSDIFSVGGEWQGDRLTARAEISSSRSTSTSPRINTTLNFINPNAALNSSNENGTPFEYDLRGGSLAFGIASGEANAPSAAELLDPANVVLRDVQIGRDEFKNQEDALRLDFSYDLDMNFIKWIDVGWRYNKTSSTTDEVRSSVGLRSMADSPSGSLFEDLLVAGPNNFGDADGRSLFVKDFLVIDPELVASNPDYVLDTLNAAITAHGGSRPIDQPTSSVDAFFDIDEETNALYAQANFEQGIFSGNFGVRYVQTDLTSVGNSVTKDANGNDVVTRESQTADYSFLLPRVNIVAALSDDLLLRGAWSKDVRRPDFNDLSTSVTYSTSPNPAVAIGNPALNPEKVTSFDLSAEWYFAESSVVSIGYFHKTRTGLFVGQQDDPYEDPNTGYRDIIGPDCEQGGIWNPIADTNVFAPTPGVGVCVPKATTINDNGETTQQGIELAFQYDLAGFEQELGWASGFGIVANYTMQEFDGGKAVDTATSRAQSVFDRTAPNAGQITAVQSLIDLSENAYNFTLYYEKYDLSARMRYTWREAYRSTDFGSTSSFPWGFPVVQEDRGQLNASVNYDVTDQLSVALEGINLTESDVRQSCVNEGALNCFQGLTDRRVTFGASYKF
ncbi:TonB-dependent receptor [Umboniibacter marinipuniceus]|uniref:TonB-dependent receptor n=1 Tax=Umboniibacter marinipuniceus TaxID=569599 RepID=A0A3M0ACL5_9GAMM|nr:TonB-dependent receptor [Umboniibacter marinipuniceus]RMA82286.1 TonB-dependent receptor [Umboniibacter marinipuniceus]